MSQPWTAHLPALNAALNATAAVLLLLGRRQIARREVEAHRTRMLAALAVSTMFLTSYLVFHAIHGSTRFAVEGAPRMVYLAILLSHTVLATANVPLIGWTVSLALRGQHERHRRWAKLTWPIWLYVSVTGVVIYVMLYHLQTAVWGLAAR